MSSEEVDQRIRVAVRMRPSLPAEDRSDEADHWELDPVGGTITQVVGADGKPIERKDNHSHTWPFEYIFGPDSTNAELFTSLLSPLVGLSLHGYHGTCFAYGPTNSGKTHTMEGTMEDPGLVPRAVDAVFAHVSADTGREYLLRVSFMEIYNEDLTDLLATAGDGPGHGAGNGTTASTAATSTTHNSSPSGNSSGPNGNNGGNHNNGSIADGRRAHSSLRIREDRHGGVFIEGLSEQVVTSPSDVARLMRRGRANRHTAATLLNGRSSRSHALFRMVVESTAQLGGGAIDEQDPVLVSTLNLVDLAGSERVSQSGVEGSNFKEAVSINLSLLTLSTVIHRLAETQGAKERSANATAGDGAPAGHRRRASFGGVQHIPYRESKLTRILQNALGGNSGTAVICTAAPTGSSVEETISALRFASRAKRIVNAAKVNEVMDDAALLRKYRRQIAELRRELASVRSESSAGQNAINRQDSFGSAGSGGSSGSTAELARRADEFAQANQELEERLRQEEILRKSQALKLKRLSEMIMSRPVASPNDPRLASTPRRLSKMSSSPDFLSSSMRSPGSAPKMSRLAMERAYGNTDGTKHGFGTDDISSSSPTTVSYSTPARPSRTETEGVHNRSGTDSNSKTGIGGGVGNTSVPGGGKSIAALNAWMLRAKVNDLKATLDGQQVQQRIEIEELTKERDQVTQRLSAAEAERVLLEERVAFLESKCERLENKGKSDDKTGGSLGKCPVCSGRDANPAARKEEEAMQRLRASLARISDIATTLATEQNE